MLNDRSSALSLLETRRSGRPREMVGPGPSDAELEQILDDRHARARPWQAVAVAIRDRRQRPARGSSPSLLRSALERARSRAPASRTMTRQNSSRGKAQALVVLLSSPIRDHKIPVWEQELSCGAAAMNLLHAAHCARLCRRLDHRLAGLFAESERGLLRSRASGSPGSSSSARRVANWKSGRGPIPLKSYDIGSRPSD